MEIKKYDVWLADMNPKLGTEPGKRRPVVVVQTELLNDAQHLSTIILPLTTNVIKEDNVLRVFIEKGTSNLEKPSEVLIDQIRAIDNQRLIIKMGSLPKKISDIIDKRLKQILD